MSTRVPSSTGLPNGAALAAFAGAGVGAFAMGLISLLDAIGFLSVPALYGPAGGVTGRTTLAVLICLVAWGILHRRWKDQDLETGGVHTVTMVLTGFGILLALPPVWSLFE
jgi:multisubunit Na+/H+ antiporter MnhG subunit